MFESGRRQHLLVDSGSRVDGRIGHPIDPPNLGVLGMVPCWHGSTVEIVYHPTLFAVIGPV